MRRYNIFSIHKGLRALLYDTALALQKTEFSDFEQADTALENLYVTMEFLESHMTIEEAYIFSCLQRAEKETVNEIMNEQQQSLSYAAELKKVIKIFLNTDTDAESRIAGSAILHAYSNLMLFHLNLMSKEEITMNHLLWYHLSDVKLISIEQQILASLSPAELIVYSRWMVKGLSESELIAWLGRLKRSVRGLVFASVMNHINAQFPADRLYKITESLIEAAVAA